MFDFAAAAGFKSYTAGLPPNLVPTPLPDIPAVPEIADPTDALFSPACLDTRRQTEPGCEVAGGLELLAIAHLGDDRGGRHRTFTWS